MARETHKDLKTTQYSKHSVFKLGLLSLALSPSLAFAGAWVAEEGKGYGKLAFSQYSADDFYGERSDLEEFTGSEFSYYGEYGIGNKLAIYGKIQHLDFEQSDTNGASISNSGLGDLDIGVRYQWNAEPFVLSTSVLAKLPYLYDENDALALGNGQEDIELRVLIGKGLNQYGYVGAEFGYRVRLDEPSDEYRYLLEYGFSVNQNLYFRSKIDGIESADNEDFANSPAGNLSLATAFSVGKLELTGGWNFGNAGSDGERWGVEFTYTDDLYGDNTLDGNRTELALTRVF